MMKCVIPGTNCKILARAIHALAKIGEEMYVQPREKSLSFRCVSMSYAAYCDFTFYDNYFSMYSLGDLEEEDALKCKISMRSALAVFKSPAIDKLVETCHIKLEPNADKLIFVFKFKNSVVKTFFLPIIDCEDLSVPYTKENVLNKLSAKSRVFTDAVQNFHQNLIEITIEVSPLKLLMRNYVDEATTVENSTRTQLALTVGEFVEYSVGLESRITFCMKDLRALLTFAEAAGLPISIYFESTGKPVVFDVKNPAFEANLVLSTLNPDGDDMSVSTAYEVRQSIRKRAPAKKTPRQSGKSSIKRSTNKSTFFKNSGNAASIASIKRPEMNLIQELNSMEVDPDPLQANELGGNNVNNVNSPRNISTPRDNIEERARKRPRFVSETPSSSASTSGRTSPVVSSLGTVNQVIAEPSIFSPAWKNRAGSSNNDVPMDEDAVPGSPPPPSKKEKMLFRKRCFETTFDPRTMGYVLAEDSDEET